MPSPLKTQLNANVSPLAGRPAPRELLVDVARLEGEYYDRRPDLSDPTRMVSIGTSGHRGSSLTGAFTEARFWPSLRRFATTGKLTAPTGRFTWVRRKNSGVKRIPFTKAMIASTTYEDDFLLR